VEKFENDITNYTEIINYLTIYLATKAIPEFKLERTENYVRAAGCMTSDEIDNSRKVIECFKGL
jgi:hypothetical protein